MLPLTLGWIACGVLLQELDLPIGHPTTGHVYRPSSTPVTIDQALALARLAGGYLVSIETAEEQEWLRDAFGAQPSWLGLEFPREVWASGAPVDFVDWAEKQPGLEDRMPFTAAWRNGGGWSEASNDPEFHLYHALVEFDHAPPDGPVALPVESVPEHRGALLLVVEGLQAADLEDGKSPNLAAFFSGSTWTFHAAASPDGETPSGWGMLAWALGPRKSHFVSRTPTAAWISTPLQRLERVQPAHATAWIVDDATLTTLLVATGKTDIRMSDARAPESRRARAIEEWLASPETGCAVIGWTGALGGSSAQRKKALAALDAELGAVLERLRARPAYAEEDWLVILTSPGAVETAASAAASKKTSGFSVPEVPLVLRGKAFVPGELRTAVSLCDVVPTMERHCGMPPGPSWLDGRALQPVSVALGAELLFNGGAESQVGWRGREGTLVPGWRSDGSVAVDVYYARGLGPAAPGPEHRGRNHFSGTQGTGRGRIEQIVDVSGLATDIDSKAVVARLSGWLGGWAELGHEASLELECLNANGKSVANLALGPVGLSERRRELGSDGGKARTGLLQRSGEQRVPAATRALRVALVLSGPGKSEGAFADELSLVLERRQ